MPYTTSWSDSATSAGMGLASRRWFLPKTATLAVQPRDIRRAPAFAWRTVFPEFETLAMGRELYDHPSEQDLNLFWRGSGWAARRMSATIRWKATTIASGRRTQNARRCLSPPHPDWFARGYSASELEGYGGQPPADVLFQPWAWSIRWSRTPGSSLTVRGSTRGPRRRASTLPSCRWTRGRGGWCKCPACQIADRPGAADREQFR